MCDRSEIISRLYTDSVKRIFGLLHAICELRIEKKQTFIEGEAGEHYDRLLILVKRARSKRGLNKDELDYINDLENIYGRIELTFRDGSC